MGIPFGVSLFCGGAVLRTLRVGGALTRPRGAAPRRAPTRRGPRFSRETGGKRARGESFSPLDSLLWFGGPWGGPPSFFAWPAAHKPTPVTARPPAGRAGRGGCCSRKGTHPPPKPSPRGEGGPAKPGRMRGRPCTQPFLVEKRRSPDCRLNEVFLLLRWACRSPPHPSPSVTASPQGEASGLCSPTRKSVPNQGTYMGTVIAHRPEQCDTQRQNERVPTSGP